jgi:hypothetical protein
VESLDKISFALVQYLWLAGFLLGAHGAGTLLIDRCASASAWPVGLRTLLCLATGIGVLVVCLLGLAILGLFGRLPVAAVFAAALTYGSIAFARRVEAWHRASAPRAWERLRRPDAWFWGATGGLIALPLLIRPLQPPSGWDELMYHLPHARAWAEEGRLAIAPFRYPLFPYNFNLLYAAALLFGNDVLPHLIHGCAGALVALGVGAAGARYFGPPVGALAAGLFLASASWGFGVAYIDLGTTLFVAFAFLTLALWYEGEDGALPLLAAFLLGLAVGTKYQALFFVPIVGFWIVRRSRRPALLAGAAFACAAGGAYWYGRNLLVSGDPVHPMGGPLFGYWLWERNDLAGLVGSTRSQGGWPRWYMMPALLAAAFLRGSSGVYRALCLSGYAAFMIWPLSSWHERYLMPAYPLLALLASVVVVRTVDGLGLPRLAARLTPCWRSAAGVAVVLLVAACSLTDVRRSAARIAPSQPLRDALLGPELAGYDLFRSLPPGTPWRLYQFGFEGELYYAPVPVVGDWFGPARYRRVFELASDPPALATWLDSLGVNGLLVNTARRPFNAVAFGPRFGEYFELVAETRTACLYRLARPTPG